MASVPITSASLTSFASQLGAVITGSTNSQLFYSAGVPTTAFNGIAVPGALCYDTTNKALYANQGSLASNTWVQVPFNGANALGTKTTAATLKYGLNTMTLTNAQACTLTMPTVLADARARLIAHQSAVSTYNGTIVHTSVKYAGGSIPTQTASNGAIDLYDYYSDGTIWILQNVQQAIA